MLAFEREDFFQALKFPTEENTGFFIAFSFPLSFLRCAEMELLMRALLDSSWQYSADFEESLTSYTQYDQAHFGRNGANYHAVRCWSLWCYIMLHLIFSNRVCLFFRFLLSMTSGMMEAYTHSMKFKKNIIGLILVDNTLTS